MLVRVQTPLKSTKSTLQYDTTPPEKHAGMTKRQRDRAVSFGKLGVGTFYVPKTPSEPALEALARQECSLPGYKAVVQLIEYCNHADTQVTCRLRAYQSDGQYVSTSVSHL